MNIVYLNSHDTGRYIQPYGHNVPTPNLQRLAEDSVLFRDAHCVASTCSPSRAGLLTGQSAHGAGMVSLGHRGGTLLHPERHIAHFLARQGFETVHAGSSHTIHPEQCGFAVRSDIHPRKTKEITDYAVNYLREYKGDKPFFLDVGYIETHRVDWVCHGFSQETDSPKDGDGNPDYGMPPAVLPDHPDTRRDWLDYQHSAERLDGYWGRILDALEEAGLADDTLVLATTDHGLAFPEMKCKLTQHGTGVLQIIRFPKGLGRGKVIDALVSHLDFYPTVCELLGVDAPDWLEGHSLLPLVKGEADAIREHHFSEVTFHGSFEPKRGVRTKRWNYIRNFAAPYTTHGPNCDNSLSKDLLVEHGLASHIIPEEELYDLVFDPQERNNLLARHSLGEGGAADPEHAAVKESLRTELDQWMQATDDPLLSEDPAVMPLPQTINTWDQSSPYDAVSEWDLDDWNKITR